MAQKRKIIKVGPMPDLPTAKTGDIKRAMHKRTSWVMELLRRPESKNKGAQTKRINRIAQLRTEIKLLSDELDYRGNEDLSIRAARGSDKAEMRDWGISQGLAPEQADVRPLRPHEAAYDGELGLFTDAIGVQTLHKTGGDRWQSFVIRLPTHKLANLHAWAELLKVYPPSGPDSLAMGRPKTSIQALMSLLTDLDPLLVCDAIRPLL